MKTPPYLQHPGKVIETDRRFKHLMAIALDPRSGYTEGVVRCIVSREGNVVMKGFVDRSQLYLVTGDSPNHFSIGKKLQIQNENSIVEQLTATDTGWDFIGLEDPDIWIDEKTNLTHLYFTIPFKHKEKHTAINLGHAVGKDITSLEMTAPALCARHMGGEGNGAKEISIAPLNTRGFRFNLVESSENSVGEHASVVQVAIVEDMGAPWRYGEIAFHPLRENIGWIGGHASPGPLLPKSFMDVGEGKLLGIINGREANQRVGNKIHYGIFSVGLFIYDYEHGNIDWMSLEPFIRDSEAKTITFASQFVETEYATGVLYAHVDDSFVRAYTLNAESMRNLLP